MKTPKENSAFRLAHLEIVWTESNAFEDGTTFDSIDEFDRALKTISLPENFGEIRGGYDKTKFKVVFETVYKDGNPMEYVGRIDVRHRDEKQETSLIQHMADYIAYYLGINKPERLTEEQYRQSIGDSPESEDLKEWAEFLDILDEPTPEEIIADLKNEIVKLKKQNEKLNGLVESITNAIGKVK